MAMPMLAADAKTPDRRLDSGPALVEETALMKPGTSEGLGTLGPDFDKHKAT